MSTSTTFEQQLERLLESRVKLAKQLDLAYIKGNVSDYISLEERYKDINLLIESILNRQRQGLAAV